MTIGQGTDRVQEFSKVKLASSRVLVSLGWADKLLQLGPNVADHRARHAWRFSKDGKLSAELTISIRIGPLTMRLLGQFLRYGLNYAEFFGLNC